VGELVKGRSNSKTGRKKSQSETPVFPKKRTRACSRLQKRTKVGHGEGHIPGGGFWSVLAEAAHKRPGGGGTGGLSKETKVKRETKTPQWGRRDPQTGQMTAAASPRGLGTGSRQGKESHP